MQLWRYGQAIEKLGKRYQLKSMLGSGGMAEVCLAWDEQEKREVAVKVIKLDHLDLDATTETLSDMLGRFIEEGSLIVHWRHPHILRMYDRVRMEVLDPAHGSVVPYIVMEYMPGGSLEKRLKPGQPLPLDVALHIFEQLCSAVQYAHEHNVIHRDIKPANVLFRRLPDGTEQAVLSDFGLAVSAQATHHTFPGAGSPAYIAPEQVRGHAQKASDIFALGVLLYRLCSGKLPFTSPFGPLPFKTPEAPSQHNAQLPRMLDGVILTALSEDPDMRWQSADLFLQQVQIAVAPPKRVVSGPSVSDQQYHKAKLPANNQPQAPVPPIESFPSVNSPSLIQHQQPSVQASPEMAIPQTSMLHSIDQQGPSSTDLIQMADASAHPIPIELPVRHAHTTAHLNEKALNQVVLTGKERKQSKLPAANSSFRPAVPGRNGLTSPQKKRGRSWLIVLSFVLILVLIGGGLMIYFAGTGAILTRAFVGGPAATVSITPANQVISDTYVITGVAGNPDPARLQIGLHPLTKTAQQQKAVTGSGHNLTQGTAAAGKLTFTNGSSAPFTIAAGTTFKKANGVVIVTDTTLVVPAAMPGVSFGNATVTAHATTVGVAGNIPAQAINGNCCTNLNYITVVNNAPFTGGEDPKDYRFVQHSDIDAVVNPLRQPLFQQVWADMQKQKASDEQLMNQIQCTTSSSTDQPVGDKGMNVPQAMATVAVKCTGTVYNRQQMLGLVKGQLQKKADSTLGTGYALIGNIQMLIKPQILKDGMVSFIVDAKGSWIYQFTDAQKQALAKQVAGKSIKDATALLQGQKGIDKVQVSGMNNLLSADPTQIAVQMQSIPGLPGSANPPAVTPTVVESTPGTDGGTFVPGNGSVGVIAILAY